MNNFDPEADRIKQARTAATVVKPRAPAPGAADRLTAAAQAEPSPEAIRLALLRKNFPRLSRLDGWVPTLTDLGCLAELKAYFTPAAIRRRRQEEEKWRQHFRAYVDASPAERIKIEIAHWGHPLYPLRRRSIWS